MKRFCFAMFALALISLIATGGDPVTIKGSDTMVILAQRWAEEYMKAHPGTVLQVTGGGSGTGIAALINGTTDICNASRSMKPSEMEKLKEKYGSTGVEVKVARDGISLYVNDANGIKQLTMAQLKDIYTGKVTNWKELGGADTPIVLYGRENSSGTYVYFKEEVLLNADYATATQTLPGTAAVVNAVSKDKNGIGYGGAAYGKGVREVPIAKDDKSPAYLPVKKNIDEGTYPISRYLYMYLRQRPEGSVKEFVDWVLSPEGQKLASEVGYFPVK